MNRETAAGRALIEVAKQCQRDDAQCSEQADGLCVFGAEHDVLAVRSRVRPEVEVGAGRDRRRDLNVERQVHAGEWRSVDQGQARGGEIDQTEHERRECVSEEDRSRRLRGEPRAPRASTAINRPYVPKEQAGPQRMRPAGSRQPMVAPCRGW